MSYDDNANLQDVSTLHCKHKTDIIDGPEILASLVVRWYRCIQVNGSHATWSISVKLE